MRCVLVWMCTALMLVYGSTLPAVAGTDDLDALLAGVAEISALGTPGPLCVYGPEAFPVIVGATNTGVYAPVAAAGRWGDGRVVGLGHNGYFFDLAWLNTADTGRFMTNALRWAAGEDIQDGPRIGVVSDIGRDVRSWLTTAGQDTVEIELTPQSLMAVDVVMLGLWNQSVSELNALSAFVRAGGGLVTGTVGWAWAYLHPDRDLVTGFAGNRLLQPLGIQWANEYLYPTSPAGYAVDGHPPELTHAGTALDAVEAHVAGGRTLTQPEIDQAVENLLRTTRCLPPDDTLLAPRLHALVEENDRWPSAERPVTKADILSRLAAGLFVLEHRRTPAESVRAHPAAEDFPGSVAADAPRVTRTLTIDTTEPRGHSTGPYSWPWAHRWHSTGLYAAPGELVRVTAPDSAAAAGGFHVRVGSHSDHIWWRSEWTRMPEISRRFSVSAATTRVANAFGGLIYVEVPPEADLGSITVEIEGAVAAPRFVLGETDPAEWRDEIRHAPAPWAEIEGRNMIVTTDSREVRGLDNPAAVAETWDRVLDLNAELAAWPSPERLRPERFVVDRQISSGYMHAGYPVMAHLDQQANLVNLEHLRSECNWGIYHEVGHNHQSPDWTFDGTVEVTVNLFTLYVYEFLCGIPVAQNENGSAAFRAKQMARYDFENPDFEQWKREPFLALVMYEQLQQAFGWEAYRQVFATYRALPDAERPKNDDEKRDQWLVRFSRQVGRNLGPFFEAWGVPTAQAARDSIADLPAWLPSELPLDINLPPHPAGTLTSLRIGVDDPVLTVDVTGAFRDPDGDALTYAATSSAPGTAAVAVSGSAVLVTPIAPGTATITVTATDTSGSNTAATQAFTVEVVRPAETVPFSITDLGGWSITSNGNAGTLRTGYGRIRAAEDSATPSGVAIFQYRNSEGVMIAEAGISSAEPVSDGLIFAEVNGPVNTGLAMANPNDAPATINFYFTDSAGERFGEGSYVLDAHAQIAKLLKDQPFNSGDGILGTFTFTSSAPVAVIALRTLTNEAGEFLMTTLPVAPLAAAANPFSSDTADQGTVYFPHFVDGGGWATEVVLVNPTNRTITGTVEFLGPGNSTTAGAPVVLTLDDGAAGSDFDYTIAPGSFRRFRAANRLGELKTGSVHATPDDGSAAPSGLVIFSYAPGQKTLSEAGVPVSREGRAFRVPIDAVGTPNQPGSIRTGLAVANTDYDVFNTVTLEVTHRDGTPAAPPATITLPPSGQSARMLDDVLTLPADFSGLLRVSSVFDVSVIALRFRVNEFGELKVTTTTPSNETAAATSEDRFFAHLADSAGWTTEFILFNGTAGQAASGTLSFFDAAGQALALVGTQP